MPIETLQEAYFRSEVGMLSTVDWLSEHIQSTMFEIRNQGVHPDNGAFYLTIWFADKNDMIAFYEANEMFMFDPNAIPEETHE